MSSSTIGKPGPLAPLQAEILIHTLGAPGSGVHVNRIRGVLDPALEPGLLEAWARALRRHPTLRAAFLWEGQGDPVRVVEEEGGFPWHEHEPAEDGGEGAEAVLSALLAEGFDPARAPLHRLDLFRFPNRLEIAWTYHHLVADEDEAFRILGGVLDEARRIAADEPLPPAREEDEGLPVGQEPDGASAFWTDGLKEFGGPSPVLPGAGGPGVSVATESISRWVPEALTDALGTVGRDLDLPLEALVRGAWAILLARQAGEEDILAGFLAPDAPAPGAFRIALPMPLHIPATLPAAACLRQIHERFSQASRFGRVAPAHMRAWSGFPGGTPLTETLMTWRDTPAQAALPGGTLDDVTSMTRWGWPLVLQAEGGPRLRLHLSFDPLRLDSPAAERLLDRLGVVLESLGRNPQAPVGSLVSLTDDEVERLRRWNGTAAQYEELDFVHRIVAARAASDPEGIAVVAGAGGLTRRELERKANRLAQVLVAGGIRPGDRVGLAVPRTADAAVGILGILRAGAAWVPLDPAYPRERIALVLEDAGVVALVARSGVDALLPDISAPLILLDQVEARNDLEDTDPGVVVSPRDPAYLIYTSGSTGRPKGVVIGHGNLAHYVQAMRTGLGIVSGDRSLHTASLAFSSSVRQLFLPLVSGATVVMASPDEIADPLVLFRRIQEAGVTVLDLVPSYWGQCVSLLEGLAPPVRDELLENDVRLVVSASEPLPADLPRRWREGLGHSARLVNMFGQTETTGIATTYPIEDPAAEAARGGIVPVGRPIANTSVLVADVHGQPAPPGATGEVWVGGAGVGTGYWNLPTQTEERFVVLSRDGEGDRRYYRTGDLGRWRADGVLEFLGRGDSQVKIRGFRVELMEVEGTLRAHPGVREGVVAARPGPDGEQRLVAWVVPGTEPAPTPREIRDHLRGSLPEYMVPTAVVTVDALSRTPTGKIDRRALPDPDPSAGGPALGTAAPPRTPLEARLLETFQEVLGVEHLGIHDHFFDQGGHSLLAIRAMARIRDRFGVDLPIRALFDAPTVAGLGERLSGMELSDARQEGVVPTSRKGTLLPSHAQERLWVIQRLDPEATAYNLGAALRMKGTLDREALQRTLTEIVRRHEVLRSRFRDVDGEPSIVVDPPSAFPLPLERVGPSEQDADAAALAAAEREVRRPFDLAAGPVFRGRLIEVGTDDHLLVLAMHHTVSDGWSRGVLYREVMTLYRAFSEGRTSPLPDLPVQYADFAAWQRRWLDDHAALVDVQLERWRDMLGGSLPALELPSDHPRPPVQTFAGRTRTFQVPAALRRRFDELCREQDSTVFMGLMAAFQALLSRYSGQEDVVVGTPTAGRTRPETEDLVGFFVNTLAIRTDLSGLPDTPALLRRVREGSLEAFANQDAPFDRVVDTLRLERDPSRSPIFQVLFILQNTPSPHLHLPGLSFDPMDVDPGAAKFDLTLSMIAEGDGFKGQVEYNTDLFEAGTIDRMVEHYLTLLRGMVESPDVPVARLPLLADDERQRMLVEWNATGREVAGPGTLHGMIEAQCDRTPDREAVLFEDEVLTYRALDRRANRLAHHLRSLGVGPDVPVVVCMDRCADLMVALLAILKAGGAYVPVDPTYPAERVLLMVEDSGAAVVVTHSRTMKQFPDLPGQIVQLDVDRAAIAGQSDQRPDGGAGPSNLAYVIYTSGSTGRPKGVMVEHHNVANFFAGMDERVGADTPGTWLAVTSVSFDISVLELFWTLARGFRVVVHGDEREEAVPAHAYRTMDFSLFYFAADAGEHEGNRYRMLLDGARFADENGLAAVWTPERHFHAFGGLYPNPSVTGAAVAAITKNVRIRAGSVVLPLHDPIRVAEEWSMVDNLSGGRAEISVASGWHDRDFVFQPQNYADRRDVLMEQIETLRGLWRGEKVTRQGPKGDVVVGILPRPIQPELNIWLTAGGTPDTFIRAGEAGLNILTHLLGQSPEELTEKLVLYRRAWKEAGHPGEGYVSLMIHTYLGPDLDTVRSKVWGPFREYLRTSVALIKDLAEGRGQDMRSASFTEADLEALLDHAFERYYQTSALMGTMDGCLEMVDRLKAIGVDECACLIDFGVSHEDTMASLQHLPELMRRANPSKDELDARPRATPFPEQIRRHGVTHLQCTPSMARLLLADEESRAALGSLDVMLLGGEAFPEALRDELEEVTQAALVNMYGPTETTIWSSTQEVRGHRGRIPLGRPITNTRFYVVDRLMQPVPAGVPGELLIGGGGVVRGYLRRPDLTADRFLPDPFLSGGSGNGKPVGAGVERVYRTGDLVRFRSDGNVEFMGRLDHQVKVRGHRIELGEIEAALSGLEGVKEAVVVVREDTPGDVRIVAYVVPLVDEVPATELRGHLREILPEYMIPSTVMSLTAFPLTPNGKIDRKQLPAPDRSEGGQAGVEYAAPALGVEEIIASIWQEILGVERVGREDNFFDLGGHSLLTIRVHTLLARKVHKPLSITDLFRFPTIRALAGFLEEGTGAGEGETADVGAGLDRAEQRRQAMQRRLQRRR